MAILSKYQLHLHVGQCMHYREVKVNDNIAEGVVDMFWIDFPPEHLCQVIEMIHSRCLHCLTRLLHRVLDEKATIGAASCQR